jgi:hypothetical protein
MKKVFFLLFVLFLMIVGTVCVNAQVTIGSNNVPHKGAVLDLSQVGELGLLLPRIELTDVSKFQLSDVDKEKADGMLVYNTGKNTIGGNGVIGLYAWDGSKWRPVSDGSGMMTLSTIDSLGMSNKPAAADGSETIEAAITDADCTMSGQYQFILLAGSANIDPVSAVAPEFKLQFYANNTGSPQTAVVQVINPCYKTATFLLYQKGADCGTTYNIEGVSSYNSMCGNGAVYAYASKVKDESNTELSKGDMDNLSYYWMLGNTQVATGRGVYLTQPGVYTVYANMQGCGTAGSISVTVGSDNAPAAHTLMITNDGIICGSNAVKLQVLNVLNGETVKWFQNGILQENHTGDKSISLDNPIDAGTWYAAVVGNNGCWSKPTNSSLVTFRSDGVNQDPPVLKINGKVFTDASLTSVCAGSTVRLEVEDPESYGPVRRFYWYMNNDLLGETNGDAIYIVPQNISSCVISVKVTTTADNCPVTTSSGELEVNINNIPQSPSILWQGNAVAQGVICRNTPALLSASISGQTAYQWFKNGNITTPIYESSVSNIFEAAEIGEYTVRYQNQAGCWSLISNPIQITQSSIPTIQWTIAPDTVEIFSTEKTYQIVTAPAGTDYSWRILKNENPYLATTGNGEPVIKLVTLGDKSSVMVSFPAAGDFPGGDLSDGKLEDMALEVTVSSPCGETVSKKPFKVAPGCTPITSVSVESSAAKVRIGDNIQFTANISTGTGPYYYQGWVYVENLASVSGISWKNTAFSGRGDLTVGGQTIPFWCLSSDLQASYPDGTGPGLYKKLLFVPWTTDNRFTISAFAVGTHHILVEAANDVTGLSPIPAIPNDDGSYTAMTTVPNTCTPWTAPAKSSLKALEVTLDPTKIPDGRPSVLNYTTIMGGKSCLDVHQTGDNATEAWGANRLPLNVRPNDFSTANLVNGNYQFSYTFKGGLATIGASSSGSSLTKDINTWNSSIKSTIQYMVDDPNNLVASVVSGNETENVTVTIKASAIEAAKNTTRNTALVFTLYAIYKHNSTFYKDAMVISIQDAACGCPAKLSSTSWIMDMCHAAGADYTVNPYSATEGAYGAYYKWGNGKPAATHSNRNLNSVRSIGGTNWDMESQNPCPSGWRVATWTELEAIANSNLNTRTTASDDRQLRGYIPIRGGGYRVNSSEDGYVGGVVEDNNCHTWSANATGNSNANNKYFYRTGGSSAGGNYTKNYGEHIRCVQDGTAAIYTP